MKELTKEWLEIAEEDLATAVSCLSDKRYRSACSSSQQCAEKYLKAVLEEEGLEIPRSHNCMVIISLIEDSLGLVPNDLKNACINLVGYDTLTRYPGFKPDSSHATTCLDNAKIIREAMINLFLT